MSRQGILFILVGPSAAGKNTLMKRVQRQIGDLPQLATATTREPRDDEVEGHEHRFVTKDAFQKLIDTGALIEYTPVHMNDWYGTPRQTVEDALHAGQDLIADIEFLGATQIHAAFPDTTVLIFVTPSRMDTLPERIRQRGGLSRQAIANRFERAKFEMVFAPKCDYLILNDIIDPAVEHLRQIIISERARRAGETPRLTRPTFHSASVSLIQYGGHLLVEENSVGYKLPTFPITDPSHPPHVALQQTAQAALGFPVIIETLSDKRFDFTAPHYVTLAAIPQDVYLYYYYKCRPPQSTGEMPMPGWAWQPVDTLNLPSAIKKLLTP
jgi:guanylate kinase